jgi:hypothetical protein
VRAVARARVPPAAADVAVSSSNAARAPKPATARPPSTGPSMWPVVRAMPSVELAHARSFGGTRLPTAASSAEPQVIAANACTRHATSSSGIVRANAIATSAAATPSSPATITRRRSTWSPIQPASGAPVVRAATAASSTIDAWLALPVRCQANASRAMCPASAPAMEMPRLSASRRTSACHGAMGWVRVRWSARMVVPRKRLSGGAGMRRCSDHCRRNGGAQDAGMTRNERSASVLAARYRLRAGEEDGTA